MRVIGITGLFLISITALVVHANRLPSPPGPAYSGFIPGDLQYREQQTDNTGCD